MVCGGAGEGPKVWLTNPAPWEIQGFTGTETLFIEKLLPFDTVA